VPALAGAAVAAVSARTASPAHPVAHHARLRLSRNAIFCSLLVRP
jgi:hypothetical protein